MSWNIDRSRERIKKHLDNLGEIKIGKLVREADLDSLLSETCCREIFGAHVYASVSNFSTLAAEITTESEYRRLVQAVHIYQREVSRLVETAESFDGVRIHFQGSKLHALFYRPIDDTQELAVRAFLIPMVIRDFVRNVFNPAFPNFGNFVVSSGGDIGSAIGTRNGSKGDRELLFLGSPANRAAKIIRGQGYLRITNQLFDALPETLQDLCVPVDSGDDYRVGPVEGEELRELVEEHGHTWDSKKSGERVRKDKEEFPLSHIEYSSATELIAFDQLSIYNTKKVNAASLFADVSGFTAYIEAAEDEEGQKEALRVFHIIRKELATVVKCDFAGVRVQFQGDRVQGLFHLPKDDHAAIAIEAVEAAAGLQSSMELVIKELLPEASTLRLAIGIDKGVTLASRLGTRGHRDRICLGNAVEQAADHEESCEGGETGIGVTVYELLPEDVQEAFEWNESAGCYIASALTTAKLARVKRAASYDSSGAVTVKSGTVGTTIITSGGATNGRQVVPARSYCP
jgi:class 3 adenylate cyclase